MKHFTNTSNPIDFPKLSTIDRLWGEALDKAVPDTYSNLSWTQVEKIKAVFAELIVQEVTQVCLRMQLGEQYTPEEMLLQTKYREIVQQHFGVD